MPQPGDHAALFGEGGERIEALLAAVEVLVEAPALVGGQVAVEGGADELLEGLVAVHRHRA